MSTMQAIHRTRLEQLRNEAIGMAGAATQIAQAITQTLEQGGTVNIPKQIAFLTGALARMQKDAGVVEYLQLQGTVQKKRAVPR